VSSTPWKLTCVDCGASYPGLALRYRCECGGTLDVIHHFEGPADFTKFDTRRGSLTAVDRSGVWRFRELVLPIDTQQIVTKPEGNTNLYSSQAVAAYAGLDPACTNGAGGGLTLKHEGENPTGSFKDRGMTVAVSVGRVLGMESVACASTGNTSASMAAYAAQCGMRSFVFLPEGKVAYGKLSQALAYGARTIQIRGNFDAAMDLVERACAQRGTYLVNSINPFRIEGQKAIAFELLQDLAWQVPDWIVLPGGNLGNSSAVAKGLMELHALGALPRLPRLAVIQAQGANPLYQAFATGKPLVAVADPNTIATAIRIGNPVSWKKCLRGLAATNGVVEQASDQAILDAKAKVDAAGIGAEPASCATVAGLRKLVAAGIVDRSARVCAILTGHVLKDPDSVVEYHRGTLAGIEPAFANPPIVCDADLPSVLRAMG